MMVSKSVFAGMTSTEQPLSTKSLKMLCFTPKSKAIILKIELGFFDS